MESIPYMYPRFGSDPEFFFAKKTLKGRTGKVVGAEKIIPEKGEIITHPSSTTDMGKVIIDGVQAEINPGSYTCRQSAAYAISQAFRKVKTLIGKKRLTINWNTCVRVSKKEMDSLSPKSKMFGCAPSQNAYDEHIELPDAAVYPYRSAGGHIHIGYSYPTGKDPVRDIVKGTDGEIKRAVKLLDILVGNTCVLVDRDPGNIERRKVYGRAGEYRTPKHGIEYRVLSNFWLRSYPLMSFVNGLIRMALGFIAHKEASDKLFAAVKEEDIRNAINNNDFDLAKANFNKIKGIIAMYSTETQSLNAVRIPLFERFVELGGMKRWFRSDPLKHWAGNYRKNEGWENFLEFKIRPILHETSQISR